MSERSRRAPASGSRSGGSSARPGDIINNTKQKRRSKAEIEEEKRAKEAARVEKDMKAEAKKKTSVRRVAAEQDKLRQEDAQARATAARPDLRTAQLKKPIQPREASVEPSRSLSLSLSTDLDAPMNDIRSNHDMGSPSRESDHHMGSPPHDHDDHGAPDPDSGDDYVDDDHGNGAADDPDLEDDSSGDEMEAQIAALLQKKREKDTARNLKPPKAKKKKGAMRAEIEREQDVPSKPPAKRKSAAPHGAGNPNPTKKPKATEGGLVADWQKVVGVEKAPKKSATSWDRSRASHASSTTSATSATSGLPGMVSSGDEFGPGAFEDEEPAPSMGITLTKKLISLDVDGKAQRESNAKSTFVNADLPFTGDIRADLAYYHDNVIPEIIDWAATLDNPFIAPSVPEFQKTLEKIWKKHFSAYPCTEAVVFLAGAAIGNWRSKIGKIALALIVQRINELETVQERRDWVAEQSRDLTFIYREPETKGGSYRSTLFLEVFGKAHLTTVLKTDVSYGHPTGAASLVCAALERGFNICREGSSSNEGVKRRGKKTASSFVASPWAERAANYLPPIKTLTLKKWSEIFELGTEYVSAKIAGDDLFSEHSTDGDDSEAPRYIDPRARVQVSDDESDGAPDAGASSSAKTVI
ncbi:hypothetical protein DFH09DRAFT_1372145 [Mycena vulgaris]|nr:hypothetical protein DFH09DRAFT_1372145 [Mycena vulgaris]